MQHAVGAPLPPPHVPRGGPWTDQAQHTGHPGPLPGQPPVPPPGQGSAPVPGPAGWTGPAPQHAPGPPARETTG
ncbi:Pro-rich N-terminal domain-containing protein, partial [Streptomyces halstedii]